MICIAVYCMKMKYSVRWRQDGNESFVKQVREDGKIDLILQKPGFEKIDDFSKHICSTISKRMGTDQLE